MHRSIRSIAAASALLALGPSAASASTEAATWAQARHAAGFALVRPTTTAGLARNGAIVIEPCFVTDFEDRRQVTATYGTFDGKLVGLYQTNAPMPCGDAGEQTFLRNVRVRGRRAAVYADCGFDGMPACSDPDLTYHIKWRAAHGYREVTAGGGISLRKAVRVARTLTKV